MSAPEAAKETLKEAIKESPATITNYYEIYTSLLTVIGYSCYITVRTCLFTGFYTMVCGMIIGLNYFIYLLMSTGGDRDDMGATLIEHRALARRWLGMQPVPMATSSSSSSRSRVDLGSSSRSRVELGSSPSSAQLRNLNRPVLVKKSTSIIPETPSVTHRAE